MIKWRSVLMGITVIFAAVLPANAVVCIDPSMTMLTIAQRIQQFDEWRDRIQRWRQQMRQATNIQRANDEKEDDVARNIITRITQVETDLYNRGVQAATTPGFDLCAMIDGLNSLNDMDCDFGVRAAIENGRRRQSERDGRTPGQRAMAEAKRAHDTAKRLNDADGGSLVTRADNALTYGNTDPKKIEAATEYFRYLRGYTSPLTEPRLGEKATEADYAKLLKYREMSTIQSTIDDAVGFIESEFQGESGKSRLGEMAKLIETRSDPEDLKRALNGNSSQPQVENQTLGYIAMNTSLANKLSLMRYEAQLKSLAVQVAVAKMDFGRHASN